MRKKQFITNVFIMSSSMLFIRIAGMATNIYISSRAGASAMGLYHMIFSVFTFGITFASSGTGFAVTRLVAENRGDEAGIIRKCLAISGVMSFFGVVLFLVFAPVFQKLFIKEQNAQFALRLLAIALPCMAASTVYRGYFIAKRKATIITASSIFEESVCLGVTLIMLNKYAGTPKAYMSLIYGCVSSNLAAFIFDSIFCKKCLRKSTYNTNKVKFKAIFSICIPIALGSYLKTALVATENLMIPLQFEKYGVLNAVGEYGIIKAMAMSVVMFPMVFIHAFSSMLVPEISEMNASARKNGIRYVSNLAINTVMMFSVFIALMLFCHHDIISQSFFKEPSVSKYLGLLSLLCIPMYLDNVADSLLKGLDLQNASLKYNIIDSALRITTIFFLMQHFGPVFYVLMIYISEIFNLTLSLGKASKTSKIKIDIFRALILPFISAFGAWFAKSPVFQALIYICIYLVLGKVLDAKQKRRFRF